MGKNSLRFKLILSVFIMTMPLVGMLLYNNFYAIHTVRGQVAETYKNMLTLYLNQIDAGLNDIDSYMNSLAGGGYDLVSINNAATDTDYYSAKVNMFNKLTRDIALYNSLNSFFVYVDHRQDFMDVSKSNDSLEVKDKIQSFIVDLIQSRQIRGGNSTERWHYYQIDNQYYLIDMVKSDNVYLGGWVRTDELLKPLRTLQIGEGGTILLSNKQGGPITDANIRSDSGLELNANMNDYYLSGTDKKFLVVGAPSNRGDFNLVALIPDHHILAKLPYLQGVVWFITIAAFFFIPLGLYALRQAILVPLNRVLFSMKKVRSGDWGSRVALLKATEEFKVLGDSFNSMMNEIETLRVNVYEEQLNKQREELQRLQLQVNPHFFLNTLNIVYNLAKVKNYELILEMTMSLIHYFRFMFRSNTSFVKLKDELEHTRNYLRIQSLRFPGQLTWSIETPDYVTDTPIPPLVIQTFVENSIKHAVTMDDPIHIAIYIDYLDESSSHLKIKISDTGFGFQDQVLQELQAGRNIENEKGEHTGIWNVQRRLRLLYSESVSINFYNDDKSGGAAVEIILPADPEVEET